MKNYAKYIDKFTVELASFAYNNSKDYIVDEKKLKAQGYYPLEFEGNPKDFDSAIICYTQNENSVLGKYYDKNIVIAEYKEELIHKIYNIYTEVNKKTEVYVDGKFINKNEKPNLSEDLLKKFLEDKEHIEKRLKTIRQSKITAINNAKDINEIKKVDIYTYPLNYFKVRSYRSLLNVMDNEDSLNKFAGTNENIINFGNIIIDKTAVVYGLLGVRNKHYLNTHNILQLQRDYNSGTIVLNQGDLDFCINAQILDGEDVKQAAYLALKDLGVNVSIDNNDMLIEGKKFCGCIEPHYLPGEHKFLRMHAHFSFNLDRELIEKVRVKDKNKEMIGINEVLPDIDAEKFLELWIEKFKSLGYIEIK